MRLPRTAVNRSFSRRPPARVAQHDADGRVWALIRVTATEVKNVISIRDATKIGLATMLIAGSVTAVGLRGLDRAAAASSGAGDIALEARATLAPFGGDSPGGKQELHLAGG